MAEELHLRRLHRLHLARADGARLHRPSGAAPAHRASSIRPGPTTPWAGAGDRRSGHVPGRARRSPARCSTCSPSRASWRRPKPSSNERTGGGVGGSDGWPRSSRADFHPPVDLRWPEYITTERGEEWWIPTPNPVCPPAHRLTPSSCSRLERFWKEVPDLENRHPDRSALSRHPDRSGGISRCPHPSSQPQLGLPPRNCRFRPHHHIVQLRRFDRR